MEANNKLPEDKRELARAMVRAGKSYREVAEALDISKGSIFNIMKATGTDIRALADEIRAEMSAKSLVLADYILNRISDYSIGQASLKERAIAAAILMDKARDMEPKPVPKIEGPAPLICHDRPDSPWPILPGQEANPLERK